MNTLPDPASLPLAILHAVAYADIFNQPLQVNALQRYLPAFRVDSPALENVLEAEVLPAGQVVRNGDWLTLKGREALVDILTGLEKSTATMLADALAYGARIGRFPFVRMVALTGGLAMKTVNRRTDYDYMVVAAEGRIWLCRLIILGMVRWARRNGVELCPNYFLSESNLVLSDRSLFTARELAQMIPISGRQIYDRMRLENRWVDECLPNAGGPPPNTPAEPPPASWWSQFLEKRLAGRLGDRLEAWERERKVMKFSANRKSRSETVFSGDTIQGHFDGHRRKTLEAFAARLRQLG